MSDPNEDDLRALSGAILPEFSRFVFPSVFGLLAISSAGLIDGIFIGNFVGPIALAAVNLTMPLIALVFGLILMIAVGGAVMAGKALGERNRIAASNIFSKTLLVTIGGMLVIAALTLLFPRAIVTTLGARGETIGLSINYLWTIAWFFPVFGVAVLFGQFVRADGRPGTAFLGMLAITLTNITLDFLLVAWAGWGLHGAALATGLSFGAGILIVIFHFKSKTAQLRFQRPTGGATDLVRASFNGFSEFLNEASTGLVVLLFNWILISQIGALGVAAFTIVDYVTYFGILTIYGVSEGLVPLVSLNYGGRKPRRILRFALMGLGVNALIGLLLISILLLWPSELVGFFLTQEAPEVEALSIAIIYAMWPMFLFNGANITISAYFTGMQFARQSALIALLRALVLPVVLIITFWQVFGFMGAFYALPVAEALTFLVALMLLKKRLPRRVLQGVGPPRPPS